MIVSAQNLSLEFGERKIFKNITFNLNEGEKVALIGDNGCGKSSLLKTIIGEYSPSEGEIIFKKDIHIGYVSQHQNFESTKTIYECLLESKQSFVDMENNLRDMESKMNSLSGSELENYIIKYNEKLDYFKNIGGYTYVSEIKSILNGLMFSEKDYNKCSSLLSGGERTRLFLGKILLEKPDLILLDEPTNYLDIYSIEWLENYINSINSTVLTVSHDRFFINKTSNRIIEINNGSILDYVGNYDDFTAKKEALIDSLNKAYDNQQREIAKQMEVIRKLRSFNREKSIKRADSRQRMLDKIELLDKPEDSKDSIRLLLTPDIESGNDVLHVENISKSYNGKLLFDNINIDIKKGDKVAIIGPNGCGKTTILKIINNIIESDSSSLIKFGSNVTVGYFDQQSTIIHDEKTIFDEISDTYPQMTNTEIRNTLSAFLFTNDDVFKKIAVLSGGEKCRVVLAKIMLSNANFLILDEPTNHLDMSSKKVLEDALKAYEGTVLYVSHDRYFINQTADIILSLNNNKLIKYIGNYDYYLEKKDLFESENIEEKKNAESVSDNKNDWSKFKENQAEKRKLENKIKKIEQMIEIKEEEVKVLEAEILKPDNATNSAKLNELCEKQAIINSELEQLYNEWETLSV